MRRILGEEFAEGRKKNKGVLAATSNLIVISCRTGEAKQPLLVIALVFGCSEGGINMPQLIFATEN
jgi:hypothetical protein